MDLSLVCQCVVTASHTHTPLSPERDSQRASCRTQTSWILTTSIERHMDASAAGDKNTLSLTNAHAIDLPPPTGQYMHGHHQIVTAVSPTQRRSERKGCAGETVCLNTVFEFCNPWMIGCDVEVFADGD